MITPEQKDELLIKMTKDPEREWLGVDPEYSGLPLPLLSALLRQYQQRGFVNLKGELGKLNDSFTLSVEINADDFLYRGGHRFEEDFFRNNFTKLEMELAKLEGEIPQEKFSNIMTLISTAAAAVSAYSGLK